MNGFIPALRFRMLTPVYDMFMRTLMKDVRLKTHLVSLIELKDNDHILDFGCWTGTPTRMIKRAQPACQVVGIDIDQHILDIARKKARFAGLTIDFIKNDGITLPYPDHSFGIIVRSYVVHHLPREDKIRLIREIYRVMQIRGRLFIMDFGIPRTLYAKVVTSITRYFEPVGKRSLIKCRFTLNESGFRNIVELYYECTAFDTVSIWFAENIDF